MGSSYRVGVFFSLIFSIFSIQLVNAQDRHPLTPISGNLGQSVSLDPTGVPWLDDQSLQPVWSWLERPATSVADFSDSTVLRPSFTPDVAGTWVAQLDLFSNSNSLEPEVSALVHISTENTPPVSIIQARGLPDEDLSLVLDGTRSYDVEGGQLTYAWSLLSAPEGHAAAIAAPNQPLTGFTFDLSGTYEVQLTVQDEFGLSANQTFDVDVSGGGAESGLSVDNTIGTFNLVTQSFFGQQEVEGRTYIGSSVQNITGQFGFAPAQDGADFDELYIDGDLQNSTVNLTPGDIASISGSSVNSNVNNGTLVQNATDLPNFDFQTFRDQSAFLASLTGAPANLSDQNNKRFGGAPNAVETEGEFGPNTRIVTASVQDLQSGGYSIDLSQADTVIINVSGQSGSFQMNPLGGTGFAENVIWNFYEATSINVNSVIVGHVLAPYASMSGFSGSTEGSVIANDVQLTNGELHQRAWLGQIPNTSGQEGGARMVAPVASVRFDQLPGTVGEPVLLEPYGSTDIDGDRLTTSSTIISAPVGSNATLQTDTLGVTSFVADLEGEYLVGLSASDGVNISRDQVLISISGGNVRPVAQIEDASATVGAPVLLDGTQSYDFDGDLLAYNWSLLASPNGSAATLGNVTAPLADFTPDVAGLYVVQLAVSDGTASSVPTTFALNVGAPLPTADAGEDQLADSNGQALLNGALSQGGALAYAWSTLGVAGDTASLDDASLVTPLLTLPSTSGVFRDLITEQVVYEIRRSDFGSLCEFDTRVPLDIPNPEFSNWHGIAFWASGQVANGNGGIRPIWVIDNQRDFTREVTLQGTDGSPHGTYIVPGRTRAYVSTSVLSNGAQMRVLLDGNQVKQAGPSTWTFNRTEEVCGQPGAQVVQLIVADANGTSLPDTVFVGSGNLRPVLNRVTPIEANGPVTLAASDAGFDANGDDLSYSWSLIYRPENSTATITADPQVAKATGPNVTFSPDAPGTYLVQLETSDGSFIAEPVVWVISVSNSVPVADATAPETVFIGDTVTLDGSSSSDPDGDALSFQWTLTNIPSGSSATIPDPFGPVATFVPDVRGTYTAELIVSDFQSSSAPASVSISTENRAPVAVLAGINKTSVGEPVVFSATDSTDPDGDPLTYAFTVVQGPNGHNATVEFFADGQTTFIADIAGDYTIQVTVSDGLAAATTTASISATASNSAPVLDALNANYDVEVGLTFVLPLNAIDPDGDPVSYFARPLPLPVGMSLNATTGEVTFAPESGAEGAYDIVFGATDGLLTDEESVTFTVVPADAGETALSGLVLDAQDFANGIQTPIADVSVRLAGAGVSTSTDLVGRFDFTNLVGGSDTLQVVPDNSVLPIAYSSESRAVRVTDNQSQDLIDAILLTRLEDGCADVVPGIDTILDSAVSGVRVEIPADSVFDQSGNPYTGQVCLGSLPQQTKHAGFDDGTQACQIYALDAQNAVFNQGLSISAPNVDTLPVGARTTLWQLQEGFGRFAAIGRGDVDPAGTSVTAQNIDVRDGSSLFAFLPQRPTISASADQPNGMRYLSMFEGNLGVSFDLVDYQAFSRAQSLVLTHNSQTADPRLIVSGDITIRSDAGLPLELESKANLAGLDFVNNPRWNPRLNQDGTSPALIGESVALRQSSQFDATGLPDGRHQYQLTSIAKYACSSVSATFEGQTIVQSEVDSELGAGWAIDGLQQLVVEEDGSVTILDDDSVTSFQPSQTFTDFGPNPVTIPADFPIFLAVDDFDQDGRPDIAVAESGPGDVTLIQSFDDENFERVRSINVSGPRRNEDSDPELEPDVTSIVAADFDRDGFLDIPYTAQLDENLGILFGDGTARFRNEIQDDETDARYMIVADLDADGFEDIVYAESTAITIVGRADIRAYFGGPDGFTEDRVARSDESGIRAATTPLQISVDDIDGDGHLDVAVRTRVGIHFAFGEGGRNFTGVTTDLANNGFFVLGEKMQLSDVDGDGLKELFTILTDGFVYYPNLDGRSFGNPVQLATPPGILEAGQFSLTDVNGDDLEDILYSEEDLTVFRSNGDGTFQPGELSSINHPIDGNFVVQDMNNDGVFDLVSMQSGSENGDPTEVGSVTIDFGVVDPNGVLLATNGEFSELRQLDDGGWERRYKDGLIVVFDAQGRQISETDPRGNTRAFGYDVEGRISSITDQNGDVTSFDFGANGRLSSISYPDGRVSEFETDNDQLLTARHPDGSEVQYRYDESGRMISVTDERGNTTEHVYSAAGNYAGTTYPDGSSISNQAAATLGLDSLGSAPQPLAFVAPEDRVSTFIDEKGNPSTVTVNEFGAIVEVIDVLGRTTTMTRNEDNLVVVLERPTNVDPLADQQSALPQSWFIAAAHAQDGQTDAFIRRDEMQYDENGNMLVLFVGAGSSSGKSQSYTYEPVYSRPTSFVDYDGTTTLYEYNEFGELVREIDPEGGVTEYTYNVLGLIDSITDKRDNTTSLIYDANNNVSEEILPDGSSALYEYDTSGNVIRFTEAAGLPEERTVVTEYDGRDREISEETLDASGASIDGKMFYEYDLFGNLTAMVDETGLRSEFTYDEKNQQVASFVPGYGTTTYEYNTASELIAETNAEGDRQIWDVDEIGRVVRFEDSVGNISFYEYDVRDNISRVTDARGNATDFVYDLFDRTTARSNPLNQTIGMSYDLRDNLIKIDREDGTEETATYDGLFRRTSLTTPDNLYSYVYDPMDNLIEASDNDSRLTMTFDVRNRLETVTTDGSVGLQPEVTLSYTYNARNERRTIADSLGGQWQFAFDERSRLETLTAPWGEVHTMSYDEANRRTALTSSAGRSTLAAYADDRLTGLEHFQNSVPVARSGFAYLDDGQISLDEDLTQPAQSRTYAYDDINRLTLVAEGTPATQGGTPVPVEDYAYDEQGNRTFSHISSTYAVDDHNRLLEDDDYTYTYDVKGNRITRTTKADGTLQTYTYDSVNQLIAVLEDGTPIAEYAYDALGRRIAKTVAGSTQAFIYDIGSFYDTTAHDRLLDFTDDQLTTRWLHGAYVDEPIALETYGADPTPGAGTAYQLHADRQGSIIAATDVATGTVAARYSYDAFGAREVVQASVLQDRGFTGREFDDETGLYYYRARHYDPALGRFLQSDPIGFAAGDLNLYAYTWNDPQNWTDPSGLTSTSEKSVLTNLAARSTQAFGVARRAAGNIGREVAGDYARGTVAHGTACLAGRVGTYLSGLGAALAAGADLSKSQAVRVSECVMGALAPVPPTTCPICGSNSFAPGTEVLTPEGKVAIETLREGDMVVARDEDTGQSGIFPVTGVMKAQSSDLRWFTLEAENGRSTRLGLTGGHPMFVVGKGWTVADEVHSGDAIRRADLSELRVLGVEFDPNPQIVHNLEIAGAHTYFAGEFEAWGHNGKIARALGIVCMHFYTSFFANDPLGGPPDRPVDFSGPEEVADPDGDQKKRNDPDSRRKKRPKSCANPSGMSIRKFQIRNRGSWK
ncbi:MAG: collagen-binding domain-containing protein [Paracoccaceae bacterium]